MTYRAALIERLNQMANDCALYDQGEWSELVFEAITALQSPADRWRPIQDDENYSPRIEALAESWASIDGKAKHLALCRQHEDVEAVLGHYGGYMAEARTMIERLEKRGFTVTPIPYPLEGR